jgi:hypothetical protein
MCRKVRFAHSSVHTICDNAYTIKESAKCLDDIKCQRYEIGTVCLCSNTTTVLTVPKIMVRVLYSYCITNKYIVYILYKQYMYRVSQNLCHKLFLGIPHPQLSKKIPTNMDSKVIRFRYIGLRSYAGTILGIT